jgi:hypothetical protein
MPAMQSGFAGSFDSFGDSSEPHAAAQTIADAINKHHLNPNTATPRS